MNNQKAKELQEAIYQVNEKLTEVVCTLKSVDYMQENTDQDELVTRDQLAWMLRGAIRGLGKAIDDNHEVYCELEELIS